MAFRSALLATTALMLLPATAAAESSVASLDLELSFLEESIQPSQTESAAARLVLANVGDFGAESLIVSLSIPEGVLLESVTPNRGVYDAERSEWQIDAIHSYDEVALEIEVLFGNTNDERVEMVAELQSFAGSFGSFDYDSTPGNMDPCEDDYDRLLVFASEAPANGDSLDAGPLCEPPPSGGGTTPVLDAGPGPDSVEEEPVASGCAAADGSTNALGSLLLGLVLAMVRRRGGRASPTKVIPRRRIDGSTT